MRNTKSESEGGDAIETGRLCVTVTNDGWTGIGVWRRRPRVTAPDRAHIGLVSKASGTEKRLTAVLSRTRAGGCDLFTPDLRRERTDSDPAVVGGLSHYRGTVFCHDPVTGAVHSMSNEGFEEARHTLKSGVRPGLPESLARDKTNVRWPKAYASL